MTLSAKDGQITVLQLVLMNETGDSLHRMRWPGKALSVQHPGWRIINLDASAEQRFEWGEKADLLVLFQNSDLDLLPLIRKRRAQGKKTLVEYNDNFYEAPRWMPCGNEWRSPILWQTYETFMKEADGVLVTGPGLHELFSERGFQPLHILKNHFPWTPEPFEKVFNSTTQKIHIGWAGSLGHIADLLAMLPTLRQLVDEYPQLHFNFMGNKTIPELLHLSKDRYSFTHWGTMEEYFNFWKRQHLGIAPLLESGYNRCRSDIKAIEMSALGTLPILTQLLPYEEFIEHTKVPTFNNWEGLKNTISDLISNPSKMRQLTEDCYRYVCQSRLLDNDFERSTVYSQYLPLTSEPYNWPVGLGYHELNGTSQTASRTQVLLQSAQNLINNQKLNEAIELLTEQLRENPKHHHLLMATAKCHELRGPFGKDSLEELLNHAQKAFPMDLRFHLLRLGCSSQFDHLWNEIIALLFKNPDSYRQYFRKEILRIFFKKPRNGISEQLLKVYPDCIELKLYLAEEYDRRGDTERARQLFQQISVIHDCFLNNHDCLKTLQPGYFDARLEGLKNSKT